MTTTQAIEEARYAMVNGNRARKPIPARVVGQWLDRIADTVKGCHRVTPVAVWCDGWFKSQSPAGQRMGYSFRAAVGGAVHSTQRGLIVKPRKLDSNIAEYWAIIQALRWVKEEGYRGNVTIHTDCETAWGQLTQGWQVRAYKYPELGRLWCWASQLLDELDARLIKEPRLRVRALLGH